MLNKLIKNEFKATARVFLPAYGIFAALLVMERLSMVLASSQSKAEGFLGMVASMTITIFTVLTVLGLIALLLAPVIYAIVRFYKNLLGDEGYLSFTLPVTPGQHLKAKLLAACVWEAVTFLVAAVCGVLFFLTVDAGEVRVFFAAAGLFLSTGYEAVGAWLILVAALVLFALLSQLAANFLSLYNAMSMGQTANKHKLLASAGIYIGINMAVSFLLQAAGTGILFLCGEGWVKQIESIFAAASTETIAVTFCQAFAVLLAVITVLNGLLATGYYFLSRFFLTKKLNLA